jgi:hypothetical protein
LGSYFPVCGRVDLVAGSRKATAKHRDNIN